MEALSAPGRLLDDGTGGLLNRHGDLRTQGPNA